MPVYKFSWIQASGILINDFKWNKNDVASIYRKHFHDLLIDKRLNTGAIPNKLKVVLAVYMKLAFMFDLFMISYN